ncbi:preprotein translocase subunit YajC [Corynebacterium timonense]|uniref:Preprotein translocase subunit YajC n=1 Tax=Corynebacterium timonense TaxID=441500 RepID=A0A1H1NKJ1_9CORY|nr:preprotein translocase subunit YajC [Corynebacterium timonense]SDR99561.1 preprotein translocase subunit YajC [Corynebacterium timonense]
MSGLLILVLIVVFMLPSLLLMRKQRAQQAEVAQLRASLAEGDAVITIGGVHGTIVAADESVLGLEVAPGTVITVERTSVAQRAARPEDV